MCTHTAGVCTHAHAFHCKHTAGVHTRMHMCKHTAGACPPHCPLHPLPAGLARCPPYPPSMPPVLPMPPTSPRSGPAEPFVFLPGCPLSLGLTAGERGQVFPPTLGGRQVLPQHRAGERERRTPSLPPFPPQPLPALGGGQERDIRVQGFLTGPPNQSPLRMNSWYLLREVRGAPLYPGPPCVALGTCTEPHGAAVVSLWGSNGDPSPPQFLLHPQPGSFAILH